MMSTTKRYVCLLVLCQPALLAACGGEEEEGSPSESVTSIKSSAAAKDVARDIVAVSLEVRKGLSNGSYGGTIVSGKSGSAIVSGTVSYQSGISCGSDCVQSGNNTSLVIAFNRCAVNTASNTTTTISGTINFADTTYSRQSGLSYSSGGRISIASTTSIAYERIGTSAAATFGTRDTVISVSSSGPSTVDQHGSLSTAAASYVFD